MNDISKPPKPLLVGGIPTFDDGPTLVLSQSNLALYKGAKFEIGRVGGSLAVIADNDKSTAQAVKANLLQQLATYWDRGDRKLYVTGKAPVRILNLLLMEIGEHWKGQRVFVDKDGYCWSFD